MRKRTGTPHTLNSAEDFITGWVDCEATSEKCGTTIVNLHTYLGHGKWAGFDMDGDDIVVDWSQVRPYSGGLTEDGNYERAED